MTLKEIAKEAGVSISTVSRVLNQPNTKAASAQVQERIWNIVRKTGYVPNPVARELRHALQPTPVMQSIYGLIACSPGEVRDDPFFPRIISSIEQEAFQSNFVLKYTYSMLEFQTPAAARQSGGCDSDNLIIVGRFQPSLLTSMKNDSAILSMLASIIWRLNVTRYSVIVFLPFGIPYAIFMTGIIGRSLLLEQSRRDATVAI